MKIDFYTIGVKEKKEILKEASNQMSMPDYNVEKDWWVARTLGLVFKMKIGAHLVFKGGTSLSKSWGIIERFSEDVDLAVDRSFFDFEGILQKKQITKLRKVASTYIVDEFAPKLQNIFISEGMKDVQVEVIKTTESDQDPKLVEVHYPYVLDYPEYIKPRILLEIGCRSLIEPYTNRKITSLVDTCFPDADFVSEPIEVASVNPERTFLEKIFLLHEEFQKENIRSERMSRHLYDLFKLMQIPRCREALKDRALYDTIVNHRKQFTKLKEVDYDKHAPKHINFIPPGKVLGAYKKDYNDMRENMINGESPSFDHLLKELNSLKSELNNIVF